MSARNVLQLFHAESDGDVLGSKTITVTKPDGTPLGVSLYEVVTGGSPVTSSATNAVGTRLLYANYADLDAAAVGRVKVSYSDAPSTTFDDAFWPDPLDLFVDGMTRDRSLGGALTVSGGLTVTSAHPTDAAGSFRHRVGTVSFVHTTAYGSGYASPPTVSFTGGGGTGAAGVAVVDTGGMIGVNMTNAGSGYTSPPTISFTGGGGTGAAATAEMANEPFEVLDLGGQRALYVDGTNVRVPTGKKLAVGNGNAVENTDFIVSCIDDHIHRTLADFVYYNEYTGGSTGADVSTVRIVAKQGVGDTYNRPLEVHMLAYTGTSALPKLAIEVTSQASYVGNGLDRTGAISMRNLADIWAIPTPQRLDFGLLIGGDQYGFVNGILYQDTLAMSNATLFKVDQTGAVTCGTITPRGIALTVGLLATPFEVVYSNFLAATANGTAGGPSILFGNDTDTGFFLKTTNTIGVTTGGTERASISTTAITSTLPVLVPNGTVANPGLGFATDVDNGLILATTNAIGMVTAGVEQCRLNAAGLLDWRNGQNVAPGGGSTLTMVAATGGNGPTTATIAGFIKQAVAGTTVWVPYWV